MENAQEYNCLRKASVLTVQQKAHSTRRHVEHAACLKILRLEVRNVIESLV
jgi:hypothetical protein